MTAVAVVGCGAIGSVVARALQAGEVPGARLAGVVDPNVTGDFPVLTAEQAGATAELVVEAAGQQVLSEIAPVVLGGGARLLVVSTGALRDEALLAYLATAGAGRVHLTSGAVGGLDLLRAVARMGSLDRVRIETTKVPGSLLQPWMTAAETEALRTADGPVEVRRGPAREIAGLFPASSNVAASVALAAGSWELVEAVVRADPAAPLTSHVITAGGPAGEYRFEIRNKPSAANPKTSGVVPYAVLSAIADLVGASWSFR